MKKKIIFIFAVIFFAVFIFCGCFVDNTTISSEYELIRIHIRANSNLDEDQAIKLDVRTAVTDYLTSKLKGIENRDDAYAALSAQKAAIKKICDQVLKEGGFDYSSTVKLTNEYFPTRQYEGITVESGYYDALIIELGQATGDNWWCVIYPPLCYLEVEYGNGIRYKSKLKELVDKYFGEKE